MDVVVDVLVFIVVVVVVVVVVAVLTVIVVVAVVLVFVVLILVVVVVVLVVVRGRWGKVITLAMWQKKVVTGGNGPMAPLVVLVASGEIGKCQ